MNKINVFIMILASLGFAGCTCYSKKNIQHDKVHFPGGRQAAAPVAGEPREALPEAEAKPEEKAVPAVEKEAAAPVASEPRQAPPASEAKPEEKALPAVEKEAAAPVSGEKWYTLNEIKAKLLQGEDPTWINREKAKELFGQPYGIYLSDTDIMEVWYYNDFYIGFDKGGRAIKISSEKTDDKEKLLIQDSIDKKGDVKVQ